MSDEPDGDDDLDLSTLDDEDLTAQMHDDLYDGLADEIVEGTEILLSRGWAADTESVPLSQRDHVGCSRTRAVAL